VRKKRGFNVTINTDNRLMSATSMIREVTEISRGYSWTIDDLHDVARNAIMSAFISEDEKQDIYKNQIKSEFTDLGAK